MYLIVHCVNVKGLRNAELEIWCIFARFGLQRMEWAHFFYWILISFIVYIMCVAFIDIIWIYTFMLMKIKKVKNELKQTNKQTKRTAIFLYTMFYQNRCTFCLSPFNLSDLLLTFVKFTIRRLSSISIKYFQINKIYGFLNFEFTFVSMYVYRCVDCCLFFLSPYIIIK